MFFIPVFKQILFVQYNTVTILYSQFYEVHYVRNRWNMTLWRLFRGKKKHSTPLINLKSFFLENGSLFATRRWFSVHRSDMRKMSRFRPSCRNVFANHISSHRDWIFFIAILLYYNISRFLRQYFRLCELCQVSFRPSLYIICI